MKLYYARILTVTLQANVSLHYSFATRTARQLLELKRFILLVMYSWLGDFTAKLMANIALPYS